MGNSDSSPVYREIGYYSYDNVRGRMGRHLSCYHRCPSKYGVTKISYCCCRCDKKFTFYFNTSDGSEISGCRADEMENKNKEAEELNEEGDEFLKQENYEKAIEKYHSAYLRCTSGYSNEKEFTKKRDAAKMEWPKKLNLQGIELYNNNNFQEAINKFQKAFEVNQNENHKKTYIANKADCYKELGNYSEAIKLYNESLSLDNNYSHAKNGKACTMSKMGKDFFSTGNYVESLQHYQQAYQTCSNDYQYRSTFKSNAQKAQVEIEAFECYQRAESSIAQCNNLDSVISDYQNAFNKSEVQSQKNLYESKLQAAERIRMKLSDLDHFWDEAWEFELNERDEEAEKGFQKVKEKAAEYIKLFPYFKKFQEYSEKVDLKIEGNNDFNEGMILQDDGINLLSEAKCHGEDAKFNLARESLIKSEIKLKAALVKFEKGRRFDQRFESSVELTRDLLKEVEELKQTVDNASLNNKLKRLKIRSNKKNSHEKKNVTNNEREIFNHVF